MLKLLSYVTETFYLLKLILFLQFAQHPNMTKVELISDPEKYFDYLSSDSINVLDINLVSDEVIELHYDYNKDFVEPNAKKNVVIAAFATAYARLKLYNMLDLLQECVLYYDTDYYFPVGT